MMGVLNAVVMLVLLTSTFGLKCHRHSMLNGKSSLESTTVDCEKACGTWDASYTFKNAVTTMKMFDCEMHIKLLNCDRFKRKFKAIFKIKEEDITCKPTYCNTDNCNNPSSKGEDIEDENKSDKFSRNTLL